MYILSEPLQHVISLFLNIHTKQWLWHVAWLACKSSILTMRCVLFQYVNLRGGTGHCLPLSLRGYGSQVPVESHQTQQHRHYTASSDGHRQVGVSASQLITFHNYTEKTEKSTHVWLILFIIGLLLSNLF